MEFQTTRTQVTPKNLYPCLATITVVPHGTDTWTRRLSAGSFGSNSGGPDDGNVLTRVISGGRRKTSFGQVADRGDRPEEGGRRRSFTGQGGATGGSAVAGGEEVHGKWYWRVQAGATDNQLVLLPLTSPANPVLTSPPQPLSHAMPAHSVNAASGTGHEHGHETHEGIGTKIKNLFRRASASHEQKPAEVPQTGAQTGTQAGGQTGVLDQSHHAANDATSQATATTATAVDRVIDQTPQGDMLPSAHANAAGATNVNANAETGWPGVINGQPLASIVVDLHSIDKGRITLGGGKKHEGSWVIVHVTFNPQHTIDPIGKTHFEAPKSGTIKFEFDKDWIGAKGEAELLHHYITTAVQNLPPQAEHGADGDFVGFETYLFGCAGTLEHRRGILSQLYKLDFKLRIPMLQVLPTKMEFSSEMNMGQDNSSVSAGTGSTKKKNIPVELTAYGTTPSGKPRLFVCQTCTRAFARLEHLRRHERSHTKEKPFSCGVCQRKFSRRDLLLRHAQKLHAGCADAITRLRRKSIKRNSSINDLDEYEYEDEDEDDIMDLEASGSPAVKDSKLQAEHSIQTPYDPVQFNLNLFSQQKQQNKPTPPRHGSVSSKEPGSLQRQVFDRKRPNRLRGASFSAQSGANYALGLPQFSESYPEADSVEFSTPQILATTTSDESYWFNNLSTIPGLSEHASSNRAVQMARANLDQRDIRHGSTMSLDSNSDFGMSHHGSVSQHPPNPHHRSDSMASSSSFNTFDSVNLQYMMPNATFSANEITPATTNSTSIANNPNLSTEDYGYAFYDVPETVIAKSESKPAHSLSPIEQEMDDDQSSNHTMQKEGNPSNNNNMDVNFLNDFGELTHDFDVNTRFMPGGYSFYDDNPSVSSSGMETNSPQVVSPPPTNGRYQTSTNSHLAQETTSGQDGLSPNRLFKPNSFAANNYNKNKLFTSNIRYMISKALSKYPISGVMTPTIPSNEKLEFYLNNFERTFLYHYPFIHSSKLNEYEIMSMTANEDPSSESARVCLPLLVATMGALLTNNKNDSEHLYEASRRTIHIYLESRKSTPSNGSPNGAKQPLSSNPLWLIQSLTLSVIYGLFSDNENNVYIVIRQLNALNSLVKSSIKTNRTILFSIHGEDEEIYNKTNELFSNEFLQNDLFSNSSMTVNDQVKFKNNIIVQSQNRIVFMIYRLTNFLLMMYNVPLTLSVNDLGSLEAPDVNDEFLWNFKTCLDYRAYCKEHLPNVSLDDMLNKLNTSKVPFKDLVYQFTSGNFNGQDYGELLSQRSRFEFISLLHGIFELKQYDELNSINVPQILDYLSPFIGQSKEYDDGMNKVQSALEQFDYALLAYFVKFTTLIDIKSLKEQSWIRNVEKLTNNYLQCLGNAEKLEDDNFLQVVDCCLLIIRYILFSTPEMSTGANFQALSLMDNAEVSFGLQILDDFGEIDSSRSCIHSQVLFHAFAVLSIFSIILTKRMNNNYSTETNKAWLKRFGIALNMMRRIETFLKMKYQSMKKENEISSLMLYSNGSPRTIAIENELAMHGVGDHHAIAFGMDKTLYILKIGELILGYLHDAKIKVSIFKKLSGNLSQIRKFLIDNESRIPTH